MAAPYSLLRGVSAFLILYLLLPHSLFGRVASERKYIDTPFVLTDNAHVVQLDNNADSYVIDIRAAMAGIGERPGKAPNYWGFDIAFPADTLRLMLRHGNSAFGDILDQRQSILTFMLNSEEVWAEDVTAFESASGSFNTIQLRLDCRRKSIQVKGGGKRMTDIFEHDVEVEGNPENLILWSKGPLTVASFTFEKEQTPQRALASGWDENRLNAYLRESTDLLEGYWQYLDRENNPQYARLGGRYLLAVVKNGSEGDYDIIYVGGAETYGSEWRPMMLKGRLKSTIFLDHYDLEWIDSVFEPITRDIHAQMSDGSILSFSFPLLKTTVRFSKMPLK